MKLNNIELINVYNHGSSDIIISTRDKQYTLPAAVNGTASLLPLTPNEVEYFNGSSPAIRLGLVSFSKDIEKDVYEALRITNWEDILFENVIEDIILNPSLEKLQRIVAIKNVAVMERVRGILTSLKNTGAHDISTRVDKLVNARYNEISKGKTKSEIVLSPKDAIVPTVVVEDVDALKVKNEEMEAKNRAMEKEIADMKVMMAKLMESKSSSKDNDGKNKAPIKAEDKKSVRQSEKEN